MANNMKIKKILFLSFFLAVVTVAGLLPGQVVHAASVVINQTNFPDANFSNFIKTNYDKNNDWMLSDAELANVTEMDCSEKSIENLQGIEYFYCLEKLYCNKNKLTSLDMSYNIALTWLNCDDNKLTFLYVRKNPKLFNLECDSNQLTSLDVSQNPKLFCLACGKNQLTRLDVRKNPELELLYCGKNQLTGLDVSQNPILRDLSCYDNQLKSLDVRKNIALKSLNCNNTQLTNLYVSQNLKLDSLYCNDNQLESLDVSKNIDLESLECANTQLTSLDVSKNLKLAHLECSDNQLKSLDVSKNIDLKVLKCANTQLTSLDVSKNLKLTHLFCNNNKLTSLNVIDNTALFWLDCSNNKLTSLNVSNNTALEYLMCMENQLTSLDVSNNTALTMLECYNNQLTTLDVSTIPGLITALKNGGEAPFYLYKTTIMIQGMLIPKEYALYVDPTVEFIWEAEKSRTFITFDAGGGYGNMQEVGRQIGSTWIVPECSFVSSDEYKEFDHWSTSNGKNVKPGDSITVTKDLKLTAIWRDVSVLITFDAGGGSGSMAPIKTKIGSTVRVPECTFTSSDEYKEFNYWYNPYGKDVKPGDNLVVTHDLKLTAFWKWKEDAPLLREVHIEIPEPEAGQLPSNNIKLTTIPANAYTSQFVNDVEGLAATSWKKSSDKDKNFTGMENGEAFEAGKYYKTDIYLGYVGRVLAAYGENTLYNTDVVKDMASDCKFYVNGKEINAESYTFKCRYPIASAQVSDIANQEYTGKAFTPEPEITYDGKKLVKDTDYTLKYSNNKEPGTASIQIDGIGWYKGTKTVTFQIAHDWGEWEVITPATETSEGVETRICKSDPSHTETRAIPKLTPTPNTDTEASTETDDSTNTSNNGTDNQTSSNGGTDNQAPSNGGTTAQTPPTSGTEVKTGDTVKDDKTNTSYVITSTETNKETVTYVSTTNNTASTLTVPDTVTVSGKNYKVTEIKANAFKNNKKLKKVTLGKNIEKIGKNAFSGCKNLKNVNIKTTKLTKKTVGANAFKGIHDKAKVKVPKSKLKDYKTILKARGIKGKNQKITK